MIGQILYYVLWVRRRSPLDEERRWITAGQDVGKRGPNIQDAGPPLGLVQLDVISAHAS